MNDFSSPPKPHLVSAHEGMDSGDSHRLARTIRERSPDHHIHLLDDQPVSSITVYDRDAEFAWQAIASQDADLLPASDFPVMGDVETISESPRIIQMVLQGDVVEWRSGFEYLDGPNNLYEHPAQQSLTIKPAALPALTEGLKKFAEEGPTKKDYAHLRIKAIASGIRKQRAAQRILSQLG